MNRLSPVSRHFSTDNHTHNHMTFSVQEWFTLKFEPSQMGGHKRQELSQIFNLHTLPPV